VLVLVQVFVVRENSKLSLMIVYNHRGGDSEVKGATTHSITTLSIMTFSIMGVFSALDINDTQHNDTQHNDTQHK
jgi:hypothetical protein